MANTIDNVLLFQNLNAHFEMQFNLSLISVDICTRQIQRNEHC